jgi:L-2-hydroxyglutarate oxidase LhgO
MESVECIVVGAGVIGIAIARELALMGHEVLVVDKESTFGTATSSRNSEVIHAGIYYPRDSLMARFCVEGRSKIYSFCRENHVEHRRCGKLIVATSNEEVEQLGAIAAHARTNGVSDIRNFSRAEVLDSEPALDVFGALFSPSTGIIDSHGFMATMVGHAEAHGALFVYRTPFIGAKCGSEIEVSLGGSDPTKLKSRWLINAAGLSATSASMAIQGYPFARTPKGYFAKGSYFELTGHRVPFTHLIYPVPVAGGLGVHLTLDLSGNARFGPDIEWIEAVDYHVDPSRAASFYASIRRYWPGLADNSLVPGYAGVRPKIVPPALAKQDFKIEGPANHGVDGLIQLFGIESPGLTSSLEIASYVQRMMR